MNEVLITKATGDLAYISPWLRKRGWATCTGHRSTSPDRLVLEFSASLTASDESKVRADVASYTPAINAATGREMAVTEASNLEGWDIRDKGFALLMLDYLTVIVQKLNVVCDVARVSGLPVKSRVETIADLKAKIEGLLT